ncbi:hypothetical protein D3C71_2067870 [compost metagenome]
MVFELPLGTILDRDGKIAHGMGDGLGEITSGRRQADIASRFLQKCQPRRL